MLFFWNKDYSAQFVLSRVCRGREQVSHITEASWNWFICEAQSTINQIMQFPVFFHNMTVGIAETIVENLNTSARFWRMCCWRYSLSVLTQNLEPHKVSQVFPQCITQISYIMNYDSIMYYWVKCFRTVCSTAVFWKFLRIFDTGYGSFSEDFLKYTFKHAQFVSFIPMFMKCWQNVCHYEDYARWTVL